MTIQTYQPPSGQLDVTERYETISEEAAALMKIIKGSEGKLVMSVSGNRYLRYEAWLTIAAAHGCSPQCEWSRPMKDDEGEIIAWEARSELVDSHGRVVSTAESMCGLEENVTRGQKGRGAKNNAARSMAQTRAHSKAIRARFAYIPVMAGFAGTPAEEILGGEDDRPSGGGVVIDDD